MELTIEKALQRGISAHNQGDLQNAERLYRAILQSQPKHPDANHNLGVIAISVNQSAAALPLFKIALEANSKIEQFWLSYINALIKEKQFDTAKQLLEQAKKQGVAGEKLNVLEAQLTPETQIENVSSANPSQQQLVSLLEYYQTGQFEEAEKQAASLTQEFPKHQFGWKVLSAILKQTGRISAALVPSQKAAALSPKDSEVHYNLGNTLKELGRLDEAEASYTQAITLKPDLAEAHCNLGATLQELGRLDGAEASCRQAIALNPELAGAHNNLGGTLQGLGRLDEAEASLRQAIALNPDFAEYHCNLGVTLQQLVRWAEAEASHTRAIALKPDYAKAHSSLLLCLYLLDKQSLFFDKLDYLINEGTVKATLGSLTCRSALRYGVEKPNLFCSKPLNYVLHIDMNAQYDFQEVFIEKTKRILNEQKISNRTQSLLVNGYQTSGNLFGINNSTTDEIQKIIRLEIEKYRTNFKNSQDGLIKKWPTEYTLYGWLISMKSGGKLKPHIHDAGWLSGSLYINVPPKLKAESGNLVVAAGEEKDATDRRKNVEKTINVVTGSLVLFPASLTHYTIPFEAKEDRIVLAFDVIPND